MPHKPQLSKRNNHCYFELDELLSRNLHPKTSNAQKLITFDKTYDIFPFEINNSSVLTEGFSQIVKINKYERNPEVRKKCLDYYGCKCNVCG